MIKAHSLQHKLANLPGVRAPAHQGEGDFQTSLDTLGWIITIRYKIGIVLFTILLLANAVAVIPTSTALNLGLANLLYLTASIFYGYTLKRNPPVWQMRLIKGIQVPEKLLLCTVAVYYSGGVLSPLFILYPLIILEAIILLDPSGVYRTGILAVVFYCGLALLETWHVLPSTEGVWGEGWAAPNFARAPGSNTYALYVAFVSSVLLLTAYIANRVALLIRYRNQQIETQLQASQTLYTVANKLGNMMDEADMLTYLATTLKSLENASMCLVGLFNKDGKLEIKARAGGPPPNVTSKLHRITAGTPGLELALSQPLLQRGEPLVIDDIHQHPQLKELALKPDSHSVYIFPIILPLDQDHSSLIGGITLSFDKIKPLSQDLTGLMTSITTQAALALQRAQLTTDAQRLATEMSQLYTLGLYTGSALSKDEVLRRTSDNMKSLMNPDAYYIALYDQVTDLLSFEVFVEHSRQMGKLKMSLDKGGVTSQLIRSGKSLLVQDWSENAEYNNSVARKIGDEMLSYLGVPMLWEDRVIGVISVQCEEAMAFDLHDQRLLTALAAQTAMALENARLHQLAQDQGKHDSLTLVYNHGYFVELVRNAVAKSDTEDTQVALIMVDIDHFKHYNDSFGHVAGDNVLKMVAQALKNSVRETDAVGRWGGEEFGVLLVGVGITEAKKIARQVRRAISELSPENGHGQILPNPTISQGISSYPFPSATANDLIEEADTALYHAKKHGRNQLVVYEAAGGMKDDTTTTGHLTRSRAARDLHITTGSLGRSRRGKQLDELTATTNDLAPVGDGTNPQLAARSEM